MQNHINLFKELVVYNLFLREKASVISLLPEREMGSKAFLLVFAKFVNSKLLYYDCETDSMGTYVPMA